MKRFFTSESVTEGHPDKICDQISDALLDAFLKDDPNARVAIETAVTTGLVLVMGEVTTTTYVNVQDVVRETVRNIGYNRGKYGFDADNLAVLVSLDPQSDDIKIGVDDDIHEQGAGDQGIMFGYATNETDTYMPFAHYYALKLSKRLSDVRKNEILPYLRPDGKTQVTVELDQEGNVVRISDIVVSTQHAADVPLETIREDIIKHVITPVIPNEYLVDTTYYVNPTGRFIIGGPQGDSGVTGRKIIVDTYGGYAKHGGGAFSGKDPSKVDRSAAYMARHIAKNCVAAGLADKCEIQLSYAIGVAKPISVFLDTFGTAKVNELLIQEIITKVFDLTPKGIIEYLDLKRPIYAQTATYGHFGRDDIDVPWESLNKVEVIKSYLK
jgi:S-adenosylmethionine synthetase